MVFEGARRIYEAIGRPELLYVGLGSVWFVDFELALRSLNVVGAISLEGDEATFNRARFNRPYRNVEVLSGTTFALLPDLLRRDDLHKTPWVLWLDYDGGLDDPNMDEIKEVLLHLPPNSLFLVTFNCSPMKYAKPDRREERLVELFRDAAPRNLTLSEMRDEERFQSELCSALERFMTSRVATGARRGGAIEAFRVPYRDGAPMGTIGFFLPTQETAGPVLDLVNGTSWRGRLDAIRLPPLTAKEVAALRALLPSASGFDGEYVRSLGIDLDDQHLQTFADHYLHYPQFAEFR